MTEPLLAELATLARALAPVVAPGGHTALLNSLTAAARGLFGAGACSLALLTEDEDELHYVAASGEGADTVVGMRIAADQGMAGYVVQSGQPVAVSDLRRDPRFARDVAERTGYVPQAILAVPVATSSRLLGVLTLLDRDATRSGAEFDLQTASLFADQVALVVEGASAAADVAQLLLTQLAVAAETGSPLSRSLQQASDACPRDGLLAVASLLGELAVRSPADLRLATRVLQEFLAADRPRPGSGS